MKGYSVYNRIQQLKAQGFKRASIAKLLNIDRRTVEHYWNMSVDEFEAYLDRQRRESSMDHYKQTIITWLREYPTLSAAQVCDWLKENYSASYSDRTVSRYVKKLRKEYNLKKVITQGIMRQFQNCLQASRYRFTLDKLPSKMLKAVQPKFMSQHFFFRTRDTNMQNVRVGRSPRLIW